VGQRVHWTLRRAFGLLTFLLWVLGPRLALAAKARQGVMESAFAAASGPVVLVTPSRERQGAVVVSLYAREPTDPKTMPSCVSEELALGTNQFSCWTPLYDCVRTLTVTSRDGHILLDVGTASGSECYQPWGNRPLELEPVDFATIAARVYLGSEDGRVNFQNQVGRAASLAALQPSAAALLTSVWHRVLGKDAVRSWRDAASVFSYPLAQLAKRCAAPGGPPCSAAQVRRLGLELVAELSRRDPAPTPRLTIPAPKGAGQPWLGTWRDTLDARSTSGATLEITPSAAGQSGITFGPFGADSSLIACKANTPEHSTLVVCEFCARRLAVRLDGERLIVRLLGESWHVPCPNDYAPWTDEGDYIFTLYRVAPFRAFVPAFVEGMAHSDLGSSGGKLYYTVLGPEPARAVDRLGALVQSAYLRAGRDPTLLSLSAVMDLVTGFESAVLVKCRGIPLGRPAPQCEQKVVDALADEVVRGWIDEDAARAP
jgi:hypothetical protein